MCPGLIHRVPVKSLGCKQKKLPLALLISTPFLDRQTNKKIPKKKKKKKRTSITYKALRVDCRMEGLVKRRNTTACSVLQKILWRSESEPPVLGTTPTQVSGHHPVSLSHVFMIQISAGRRCPRTELRGLLMLWLPRRQGKGRQKLIGFYWDLEWPLPTLRPHTIGNYTKTRKKKCMSGFG